MTSKALSQELQEAIEAQTHVGDFPATIRSLFQSWPAQDSPRICAMAAHTLRHQGQSPQAWQPWLTLAAVGNREQADSSLARALSLLSQTYFAGFAEHLPVRPSKSAANRALLYVLKLAEAPALPDKSHMDFVAQGLDEITQDDLYALVANAVADADWEASRKYFDQLAQLVVPDPDPEPWNAEINPGYEPVPAALAAAARHAGLPLETLLPSTRSWLWPAVESQPGIFPARWPITFVPV